jgi:hypothetical protein
MRRLPLTLFYKGYFVASDVAGATIKEFSMFADDTGDVGETPVLIFVR